MKYNIKEGDKLWTTVTRTESVSDGIRLDRLNWSSECIILEIYDDATIGLSENIMIGVADYSKLVEETGCKEGKSLGVSEWVVEGTTKGNMLGTNYTMMNIVQSAYLNGIFKEWRNQLHLNWRISSNMVINHELQWVILNKNVMTRKKTTLMEM